MKIIAKFNVEGMHRWLEAPNEFLYLAYPHRHLFYFEVEVTVTHKNRDIEFIDFSRKCRKEVEIWFSNVFNTTDDAPPWSCESMARSLIVKIRSWYPGRFVTVRVFEDNENGAEVSTEDV